MLSDQLLLARYDGARQYLQARQALFAGGSTWLEFFELYRRGRYLPIDDQRKLTTPQIMTLCDPGLWARLSNIRTQTILGPEAFPATTTPQPTGCDSELIFGYECPLAGQAVESDHVFPRSLGGKTDLGNHMYLCRFHNRSKGADIHFYPWEKPPPAWVDDVIQSVRSAL